MINEIAEYKIVHGKKCLIVKGSLTNKEQSIIDSVFEQLARFDAIQSLFYIVTDDVADLSTIIKITEEKSEDVERNLLIGRQVKRSLIHYLLSAKLYLEHVEMYLKKHYGENSNEFIEWKKIVSNEYDEHFEYRFLYHLRNYIQHYGVDFFGTVKESKIGEETKTTTYFDRDKLVASHFNWKKILNELQRQPARINIIPFINEYNLSMSKIYIGSLNAIVREFCTIMENYFAMFQSRELTGLPFIIKFKNLKEKQLYEQNLKRGIVSNLEASPLPREDVVKRLKEFEKYQLATLNINYVNPSE